MVPGIRLVNAGQRFHQGGLSAAIRTKQRVNLTAPDAQAHIFESPIACKGLGNGFGADWHE